MKKINTKNIKKHIALYLFKRINFSGEKVTLIRQEL